ncbi:hypothetical protein ACGFYP_08010 [Streptomyces sp. NPDC048370]|uniref:protein kinase domain-containing protein n=1 Tax=Streptomyces sp. NPDC048370 TaxID=3365540 RepID=UPI003724706F
MGDDPSPRGALKPGNIVLADDGPRVLDFGIARALAETRLTTDNMVVGTPGFLAPEQAQGLPASGATDVFALGAVLIAAAGACAFGDGRAVHEAADLAALPPALRPLAAACLSKDPRLRTTPRQVLEWCVAHREVVHPPDPPGPSAGPLGGRRTDWSSTSSASAWATWAPGSCAGGAPSPWTASTTPRART